MYRNCCCTETETVSVMVFRTQSSVLICFERYGIGMNGIERFYCCWQNSLHVFVIMGIRYAPLLCEYIVYHCIPNKYQENIFITSETRNVQKYSAARCWVKAFRSTFNSGGFLYLHLLRAPLLNQSLGCIRAYWHFNETLGNVFR